MPETNSVHRKLLAAASAAQDAALNLIELARERRLTQAEAAEIYANLKDAMRLTRSATEIDAAGREAVVTKDELVAVVGDTLVRDDD